MLSLLRRDNLGRFILSLCYSVNKYLLIFCFVPSTVVATVTLPWEFYILIELVTIKRMIEGKLDFLKYHV